MEMDEHWLHSHRRHVIKTLGHLRNARILLDRATDHAKKVGLQSEACKAIESNIDALCIGLQETITLCGQAAEQFKQQMSDPTAKPSPVRGALQWKNISPLQRALINEGRLVIDDIPKTECDRKLSAAQKRAPKTLAFTTKRQKQTRRRTHENFPL